MYHVLLLLLVTLKFYTIQDKTAQVLKFSNSNVHHSKFIQGRYAKSMLAIIPGTLPSEIFFPFCSPFCFAFFSFI